MKKGKEVEHIYGFGFRVPGGGNKKKKGLHPQLIGTNLAVLHLLEWKSIYQCTLFLKNSLEGLTPGLAGSR
jgi:hypothetical protein